MDFWSWLLKDPTRLEVAISADHLHSCSRRKIGGAESHVGGACILKKYYRRGML